MASRLRLDNPAEENRRGRIVVGVYVSSDCRRVRAALLNVLGRGLGLSVQDVRACSVGVADETRSLFGQLAPRGSRMTASGSVAKIAALRAQLAETQAMLAQDLLATAGLAAADVLAVGVHDPGLWCFSPGAPTGYVSLCDPARLAELTGMNVVDAFPARDLAGGGKGGPLALLPQWLLLRAPQRQRLLVDLGRTIRVSRLPADTGADALSGVATFEIDPGMGLLDRLAERLTNGEHKVDQGGRFAVQGRRIPQLLESWLNDSLSDSPPSPFRAGGVDPEQFLNDSVRMAVNSGWSVRDMLCTATHFLAGAVLSAISRCRSGELAAGEIVLSGGGRRNGLLLGEIAKGVGQDRLTRIESLGLEANALDPACGAMLALLNVDQIPASLPAVTGIGVPRLLGRLTPGSPRSWRRLLSELAGSNSRPLVRPLRSAL